MKSDEKPFMVFMTGEQLRLLSEAANLVSRLHVGQLGDLARVLKSASKEEGIREKVEELAILAFPDKATKEPSEPSKVLFDIHQVFRNVLALEENPEGRFSVDFDDPFPMSGRILPKVFSARDLLDSSKCLSSSIESILNMEKS